MSKNITVGGITIGAGHAPVFFAEIGTFFNQDTDRAIELVNRIAEVSRTSPTPVILKGEILHDPEICLRDDIVENYVSKSGEKKSENFRELIERKVVPLEKYREIFGHCNKLSIPYIVSVYDNEGAVFAKENGAAAIKIASPNLIHIPLVKKVASLNLPIILDTGRATLDEVVATVAKVREAGCEDIILEHSPDGHPALPENHNLRTLTTFQQIFDVPVGLSDHHVGDEMMYASVVLGASVLEKGITFDSNELEQDSAHAMSIDELPTVLQKINNCWVGLGDSYRDINKPITSNISSPHRRGIVAKRALSVGDVISEENVYFAFPCKGISVKDWEMVEGSSIANALDQGEIIQWSHIKKK